MKKTTLLVLHVFILSVTQAQFSIQNALLEVFTGTWNQYSPDAFVKTDSVLEAYPKAFAVNVHSGDSLTIPEGEDLETFYSPSFPQALINRSGTLFNRGLWMSSMGTILSSASSVTVKFDSVQYNNSTRKLDVYLQALFTGPVTGDLRFNCILVEDSVSGTGTGYDQVNYYNTSAGHQFYNAGNPIVGYIHRYVARKYLGGTWGTSGVIPNSVSFGSSYTYHYTYTLPANFNASRISLVGLVCEYQGSNTNERKILNAEKWAQITTPVVNDISDLAEKSVSVNVYPNPSSGKFFIAANKQAEIEIANTLGELVFTSVVNGGVTELQTVLPKGNYLLKAKSKNSLTTSKLIVTD